MRETNHAQGTRHGVVGTLRTMPVGPVEEMEGGERWRVDPLGRRRRHPGRRVAVEGRRTGFDPLTVERMFLRQKNDPSPESPVHAWLGARMRGR
ncbi:DUF5818 domain-containing protein [Sphingomonas abaci]|uniref:Uncharacterized protein n=1 Tax=Sphingomonas abaci TaxID=237611 RepID=A0A7W7ALG5_9SPHN|nr:DUF5818 domain-containing protein [Sphingomonas abaci]MBB4618344.1 hypothetical protein [Sphingomonas abaci]